MNNNLKGYLYEKQIKNHIINNMGYEAYLWDDVPETLLLDYGIIGSHNDNRIRRKNIKINPLNDTGVDIIFIDNNNKLSLVQCKNGYESGLTFKDLSGISLWTIAYYNLISKSYIYYTHKISNNIKLLPFDNDNKFTFVKQGFVDSNTDIDTDTDTDIKHELISNKVNKIIPFDYQLEAEKNFKEYYENNSRGILTMPCGTGKTYTSFLH